MPTLHPRCSIFMNRCVFQHCFPSPSAFLARLSLPLPPHPPFLWLLLFLTPSLSCLTTAPTGTCTIKNSSPLRQPPQAHHLEQSDSPSAHAAEQPGSWGRAGGCPSPAGQQPEPLLGIRGILGSCCGDACFSEQWWKEKSRCRWKLRAERGCGSSRCCRMCEWKPKPRCILHPARSSSASPGGKSGTRCIDQVGATLDLLTVNSPLWKMVNKDMNGFPVKKCSAFQFFKKRVRTGFVCFFCFLLLSEMPLIACRR